MRELATKIAEQYQIPQNKENEEPTIRCFCDTAPVLERYWAQKAGLGWVGRNHQLIIPHAGSMFFLGEIFLPLTPIITMSQCPIGVADAIDALMRVLPEPSFLMRISMPNAAYLIN